jgi:hypothetical protein
VDLPAILAFAHWLAIAGVVDATTITAAGTLIAATSRGRGFTRSEGETGQTTQ